MQPTPRLRRFVLASAATVALGLGLVTVSAVGVVSTPGVEASTSATLYAGTLYSALAPAQS